MLFSTGKVAGRGLTAAEVRARLAGAPGGGARAPAWRPRPPGLTPAAVLVALVTHAEGLTVIFTRRTEHLSDHAGQVSFPGGRVERADADPVATALREAEEEIGLGAGRVDVIGALAPRDTSTGFGVVPVIGLVTPPVELVLDDFEVAEAFEVPLDFLLDPANRRRERRIHRGRPRAYFVMDYDGRTIWGATARIIVDLCEVLGPR